MRMVLLATMLALAALGPLPAGAQENPLQTLLAAARANDAATLRRIFAAGLPGVLPVGTPPESGGTPGRSWVATPPVRDAAAVWGQDFLFATRSDKPVTIAIDGQAPQPMTRVEGSDYWYRVETLPTGVTHNYTFYVEGRWVGSSDVAGYLPDSYPRAGVLRGTLSERRSITSRIYPGMTADYWIYTNAGVDPAVPAPLMVWQDGASLIGDADLTRLRMQIVTDNLVASGAIPPMVHVLIAPGNGPEAQGAVMRSIQYDTVSDRYGRYLMEEVLPEVERSHRLRQDAYSRAISGQSSGAIAAFNVAWYFPERFSRVQSHIGSYVGLQWRPEEGLEGGFMVPHRVRREDRRNLRVWLSDGSNDIETDENPRTMAAGSWPLNNIQLANALKLRGYDFHFRFGVARHNSAQGALDLPESLAWLWRGYDPSRTEQVYEMEERERALPLFRVRIDNR